jgi:hypothetical protein
LLEEKVQACGTVRKIVSAKTEYQFLQQQELRDSGQEMIKCAYMIMKIRVILVNYLFASYTVVKDHPCDIPGFFVAVLCGIVFYSGIF